MLDTCVWKSPDCARCGLEALAVVDGLCASCRGVTLPPLTGGARGRPRIEIGQDMAALAVRYKGGASIRELSEACGVHRNTLANRLYPELVRQGIPLRIGRPRATV